MIRSPLLSNFELLHGPSGEVQVLIGGRLDVALTHAARGLGTHISKRSIPAYLRTGAALFGAVDAVRKKNGSDFDAWSEPRLAKLLWREALTQLECTLRFDDERKCYVVDPPPNLNNLIRTGLSGAFHLYSCAVEAEVAALNPLKLREPQFKSDPVSLFRLPLKVGAVRSTRAVVDVAAVLACLRGRVPPNVMMMFELMSEGLARIMEQASLTVWDWAQHGFGTVIATPDKWDNYQRTKEQQITPILLARMLHWFDHERVDPHGRSRKNYLSLARAGAAKDLMMATPLFPNDRGGFYSYSGIVDVWFRPSLSRELAGTVTHAIRIAGVNSFIAWVNSDETLTPDEKAAAKAKFAVGMGWRWHDKMLEYYGAPERRAEVAEMMGRWANHRHESLKKIADSPEDLISNEPISAPPTDRKSSNFERLMRLSATK